MSVSVALIANPRSPVLAVLRPQLPLASAGFREHATPAAAAGTEPDLIVVCQDWPDEYARADVVEIIARWPLARLVCAYGPWCNGDGRTRDIWPLAVRVPVDGAAWRIARELEVIAGRRKPLPITASRTEIFESLVEP